MSRARSSLYLVGASFAASLMNLVAARFYLHVLGEVGMGLFLFMLSVVIVAGCVDIGYFRAAQREVTRVRSDPEAGDLQHHVSTLMFLSWRAAVLCLLLTPLVAFVLPLPGLAGSIADRVPFLIVAGVQASIQILMAAQSALLSAAEDFKSMSILQVLRNGLSAVLGVAAVFAYGTPMAALIGSTAGFFLALLYARWAVGKSYDGILMKPTRDDGVAREYTSYARRFFPQRLAYVASGSMDRLILGTTLGATKLTWYAITARLPQFLGDNMMDACFTLYPDMVRSSETDKPALGRLVAKAALLQATIGVVLVLAPCLFAPGLLHLIFGAIPPDAQAIAVLLGFAKAFELVQNAFNLGFMAANRPGSSSMLLSVRVVLTGVALLLASLYGNVVTCALVVAVSYLVVLLLTLWVAKGLLLFERDHWVGVGRVFGLFGAGAGAITVAWATLPSSLFESMYLSLALAPLMAGAILGIGLATRTVLVPAGVHRRLPTGIRRLIPN